MKKLLVGGLAALVIVAVGAATYGFVFRDAPEVPVWTVATYTGDVLASVDGSSFEPVDVKMKLANRDRVRTGETGELTLVHGASHVTVRSLTEIQVADLRTDASKFSITSGVVYVEARGERIVMRAEAGAAVDAVDAGLGMTVKRDGHTVVQVKRGEADFSSMGGTERVKEGQWAEARAGRPPTRPVAIPEAILLNVQFPDAETFATRLMRITGQAEHSARVKVAGRTVDTDEDGRFAVDLELEEGVHPIEVEATDGLGRTRTATSNPFEVDVTAPALTGASIGSRAVAADHDGRTP